jgi:uncharacterized membrane protein YbhN (UPF0104 family)
VNRRGGDDHAGDGSREDAPGQDAEGDPGPGRRRVRWRHWVRGAASVAVAITLLLVALPQVTGAGWNDISAVLSRLSWEQIALLAAVWVLGLIGYTWVLTGGLPGLTHAQALVLNLTSSAVSNLVPFGGALGVAVSYAMVRSWGFGPARFALSTLVTGIWNVMAKLALPVLALFALVAFRDVASPRLTVAAASAAVTLALVIAGVVGALSSERFAHRVGRTVDLAVGWVRHLRRSRRGEGPTGPSRGLESEIVQLRHRTVGLVRGRWHHLTFGMVAFLGAQALLQWLSLRMLGSSLSPVQVFAGFAFGRLLTSVVVTPGGVGFSETGAAGLLVAFGGDPAVSASGVLLFSGFAYFLEIWAGGLGYAAWALRKSWRRTPSRDAPAGPGPGPGPGPDPAAGRMGT